MAKTIGGATAQQRQEDQKTVTKPAARIFRAIPKLLLWSIGSLLGLLLLLFIAPFFLDEPLRKSMESNINSDLKGYSVRLPELHLQLIGLSVTLRGLTVSQQAHPEPPVAEFPHLKASIHWRQILSGKLVAKFEIDGPKIYLNLQQLRAEAASNIPIKERGWQQAVADITPLQINLLTITNGEVVYIDQDPDRPLQLSRMNLQAENIRNIQAPDQVYPSPFHLETVIFGTGHGVVQGKANFLAEPFPAISADFKLEKVPLNYFRPVFARANLSIRKGEFFASGRTEYAPNVKTAHLKDLTITHLEMDYIHTTDNAAVDTKGAIQVKKAAGRVSDEPSTLLRLDNVNLIGCTIGMINRSVRPPYRVFFADTDVQLTNLSNQFAQGPAEARMQGKFMGSGDTTAVAHFRPEKKGPDFDINLEIKDTKLVSMNDMLRAYGNFDVSAGFFSLYTEVHVENDAITGYIKPLFRDIKAYDKRTDEEKNAFQKMYEQLVGGVAKLLENRPRAEVATKVDLGGPVENPETSTLQIIAQLIKNAFFKAILPGFEQEMAKLRQ